MVESPPAAGARTASSSVWLRWSGWLAAGVLLGLALGFTAGLTKPRPKAAR